MPHLLTCTDGSIYAPSIYAHSAWAAARLQASIKVLHVLNPHHEIAPISSVDLTGAIGFNASVELAEELVRLGETQARIARLKGDAILEDAAQQLAAAGIAASHIHPVQRHGSLADTLAELEQDPATSLVVIGKRGEHCDFATGHLGGEVQRIIRTSVRPVLVTSRAFQPIESFLIAYDGGPSARKAVDYALHSPLLKGLNCHLLRTGLIDDAERDDLDDTADKLRDADYYVTSEAIEGDADEVITTYVQEQSIDLLVMGAYGHGPLREFFLGSTTTTMVRTCPVPLLMFR